MKNRLLLSAALLVLSGATISSCSKEKIHEIARGHSQEDSGRSAGSSTPYSEDHSSNGCGDHSGSNSSGGGN